MSVLDAIDTTVTCEWGETRTIGTLVRLGGREAVITALRAPAPGDALYLRVEGETPEESVALDGACKAVADSDWGEHEVTIEVQRVGSTVSAAVLKAFIERHDLARGGSVSVGRNRDNPDLKRFVYSLPAVGKEVQTSGDADTTRQLRVMPAPGMERLGARSEPSPTWRPDFDMGEQILVTTVPADAAVATPMLTVLSSQAEASPRGSAKPGATSSTSGVPQPSITPARTASDSILAVQRLFAADTAVRANLGVQFDVGKKRRQGVLLRLGESRVRVKSLHQPQLYDRLTLQISEPGRKDPLQFQVEVTRVRQPERDGGTAVGESAFDARLTGNNSAAVMTRLRGLVQALSSPSGDAGA
jgi:hypothetical protein